MNLNKLDWRVSFLSLIFVTTLTQAKNVHECKSWVAKMVSVNGKIEARRTENATWTQVNRNSVYCSGDQIRAAINSKATLVFANETLVTLDEQTAIVINQIKTDGLSIFELLKGIAHFISRVPRSLKILTPSVNAAIEGTEFVVSANGNETKVTVFEGVVLTANEQGELRVTHNETSVTHKGSAPEKILMAHPRDAVQWAIYFPPVNKIEMTGEGENKAKMVIDAIINNQKNALTLAKNTVSLFPDLASSYIALSYAWQSKFKLSKALQSAKIATEKESGNAIAWARLAEMQLSKGELSQAQKSAKKASELDASNARAKTMLGYAYLTQIKIAKARQIFNKAIELDQSDPLPHLGLGLAMIRKNELKAGRREIEIAAALDPNNSIIRSYLGKAYYEEKRGPLDADQFEMAKALDQNDPTPYFYDAIRKQAENNPVGALNDLNKSIELNDNRAVYRSSLQLDQDEAVRNIGVAKIFNDISFNQLSILEGAKSVTRDPSNHSGHRFLADAYAELPRHEIAQESELLQAKLFSPLIATPVQLLYTQPELPLQTGNARSKQTISENKSVFISNGVKINSDIIVGSNNTMGENISLSGIYDKFSFSLGQLAYKTDGYRANNDQDHDLVNLFMQYNFTPDTSLQLEVLNKKSEYGDIESRFDLTDIKNTKRFNFNEETIRIGLRHAVTQNSSILFSIINSDEDNNEKDNLTLNFPPTERRIDFITSSLLNGNSYEAQYLFVSEYHKFKMGIGLFNQSNESNFGVIENSFINGILTPTTTSDDIFLIKNKHSSYYIYDNFNLSKTIFITLGLSYDDFLKTTLSGLDEVSKHKFNPKFGLEWDINANTNFRLAVFSTLKRALLSNQTMEPTQISGFNQFFDGLNASESDRYNLGFNFKPTKKIFTGIEFTERKMKVEVKNKTEDQNESLHKAYFYWTPSKSTALSSEYNYFRYKNSDNALINSVSYLRTQTIPIRFSYFKGGFYTSLSSTFVDQKQGILQSGLRYDEDSFTTIDFEVGYKFKSRTGQMSLYINNLLGEEFNYRDRNFQFTAKQISKFIPERTIFINVNLNY